MCKKCSGIYGIENWSDGVAELNNLVLYREEDTDDDVWSYIEGQDY